MKLKYLLFAFIALFISACAYTTGTEVSQEKLDSIVINKSKQSDVEKIIGYPARKQTLGNKEVWYYDFTRISANPFGGNVDESTVIEFNSKGIVVKKYKAKGTGSNPLLGK